MIERTGFSDADAAAAWNAGAAAVAEPGSFDS
jgi:hypothetical protein